MMTFALLSFVAGACDRAPTDPSAPPVGDGTASYISLAPEELEIGAGETHTFVARIRDEYGDVVSGTIEWEITGGRVDENGAYRAPRSAGTYEIIATDPASGLSAAGRIKVVGVVPTEWILPGDDIQAIVDDHAPGTEFRLKPGIHRLQTVRPKQGNIFAGDAGAILSGARVETSFRREGSYWVLDGQTQESGPNGLCWRDDYTEPGGGRYLGCRFNEDLFIDDVPLFQVTSLGQVQAGRWYFDYGANRIYFADNPTGRKVEVSVAAHAFDGTASNVTIRGITVEKYANRAQSGAIHAENATGWIIEQCEVRFNHGRGVHVGERTWVIGNNVHHNGQLGIGGIGDDILIEDNEIAYNNNLYYSGGWEAGGTKLLDTRDLVVRGNFVHHNRGPGLWTDWDNIDTLYEGNRITDNVSTGLFHEISYAAVIRNNVVERNGQSGHWLYDAGILIAHSPNVEVYGNIVTDNAHGITGIQQDRGGGKYGAYHLENLWVHDNTITMTDSSSRTGMAQSVGDTSIFTSRNNRFDNNTYHLGSASHYFEYQNAKRTEAEWQGYGQDPNGEFHR